MRTIILATISALVLTVSADARTLYTAVGDKTIQSFTSQQHAAGKAGARSKMGGQQRNSPAGQNVAGQRRR